jgi:hypothetical protein
MDGFPVPLGLGSPTADDGSRNPIHGGKAIAGREVAAGVYGQKN